MKKYNILEILLLAFFLVSAFLYRYSYYLSHYYLIADGIASGGDFQYYFEDPVQYVLEGKLEFYHCGNTGILLPILGVLYKCFGLYPGVRYFAILMVFISSLICIFPYFICRRLAKGRFTFGGTVSVFLLIANPVLIEMTPYIFSDILGLFILTLSLFFLYRAVDSYKLSDDYLMCGVFLAILPFARTVYIPIGFVGIFVFVVIILLKDIFPLIRKTRTNNKALWGIILKISILVLIFSITLIGYENFIRDNSKIKRSGLYVKHFMKDGFKATCIGIDLPKKGLFERQEDLSRRMRDFIANAKGLKNLIWEDMFKNISLHSFLAKCILFGSVIMIWRNFYLIFPLIILGIVYYVSVAAYVSSDRYMMPLILIFAIAFGFVFDEIIGFLTKLKKWLKINNYLRIIIAFIGIALFIKGINALNSGKKEYISEIEYFKWIDNVTPPKSLILTSAEINPWLVCEFTKRPVIYKALNPNTILIDKVPYLAKDFRRFSGLYGNLKAEDTWIGLAREGYKFIIIENEFVKVFLDTWKNNMIAANKKSHFKNPVNIANYGKVKGKSVYLIELDENHYSNAGI